MATEVPRRGFLLAAGGALAAPVLLGGCTSSAGERPAPSGTPSTRRTADLAVRWRHVEPRVVRDGLLAAWPFDEGAGYAFADVSGHGHTGYVLGSKWETTDSGLTSAIHRRGRRGRGVHLDGTRWVQIQHSFGLDPAAALGITCWLNLDAPPKDRAEVLTHGQAYALVVTSDGTLELTVAGRTVRTASMAVPARRWVHVAGSADVETGRLSVWVDGVRRATANGSVRMTTSNEDAFAGMSLTGRLDELTLHGVALDDDAVADLRLVGLGAVYTQTRATIDPVRASWSAFGGSEPVPHPKDTDTSLLLRFDRSIEGGKASGAVRYAPASFGAGLVADEVSLTYPQPLRGSAGTVEAWYEILDDPRDPGRTQRKELLRVAGDEVIVYTAGGRWCADVGGHTLRGPARLPAPDSLGHVAVAFDASGSTLFVDGVPVDRTPTRPSTLKGALVIGGGTNAPAYCLVVDVRVSTVARGWGAVCPHGQATTEAAGLDLRDRFSDELRLWRPMTTDVSWQIATCAWAPASAGEDPDEAQCLRQSQAAGRHSIQHPYAYGQASSIQAGVSFATPVDGWAGVYVQSSVGSQLDGHSFAINPARRQLRLARYVGGTIAEHKVLTHDFAIPARRLHELTLTAAGDGVLRGFVEDTNVISMQLPSGAATHGYAGLFTDGAAADFDQMHFTALTPATAQSRLIEARVITTGGAGAHNLQFTAFRWHKRRGLAPWQYTSRNPELPGNIAGARTSTPARPIAAAYWRSQDSANSDLIRIDGKIVYFMRGTPSHDGKRYGGRIGVLHQTGDGFDGVHFDDPHAGIADLDRCGLLQGHHDTSSVRTKLDLPRFQLNEPSSAYVGDGRILVFANEKRSKFGRYPEFKRLVYSYYGTATQSWTSGTARTVPWSSMDPTDPSGKPHGLLGGPELLSLRDPDTDEFRAVLFYQTRVRGQLVMTTAGLRIDAHGVPQPDPAMPPVPSIGRPNNKAIYSFRVLHDNGIYYLHYVEGPQVPDFPSRFVLASATDPYRGSWVVSPATAGDDATYFTRGAQDDPDNGAIWGGDMVKHRGRYYLYYENWHATDDVDKAYQNYDELQSGSRVGYAAN